MASEASQSDPGWVRWAPAALLAGVAILALALQLFVFPDPTTPDDWERASKDVIERVSGDESARVRVHPTWRDAALTHLTQIGSQIDRKRTMIPEDLFGVSTWIVIAEKGRRDEALDAFPGESELVEVREFGSVETFAIKPQAVASSFNLREHLDETTVTRVRGESATRCTAWNERERRWDCKTRERGLYVADELREVGDEPRRCIYAHPIGGGTILRLEWEDVELGEIFRLRSGIDLRASRSLRGDDVTIRMSIDGEEVIARKVPHRSEEWFLDSLETERGRVADIRIDVETGDRFARFFCFDGWALNERID